MDLRQRLVERLSRAASQHGRSANIARQRKFLMSCLQDLNYISQYDTEPEDEYHSDVFNRTFIGPGNERLSELQRRGIHSEESTLNKVITEIESTLGVLLQSNINMDINLIKKTALQMYSFIMNYYKDNIYGLKQNKGSLKRGYIGLVLYYSLKYHGINITESDIPGISIADLPEAQRNIKRIFNGVKGYEFLYQKSTSKKFCDIPLPQNLLDKVNEIVDTFGNEFTIASIYYVCNKMYRDRIKILIDGELKFITYSLLSEHCNVSQNDIKKNINIIINSL
jgi:hypothetical protein